MLTRLLSTPRFLAVYSGAVTLTFAIIVAFGFVRGDFSLHEVSAAHTPGVQPQAFDQITVHRINVVEPDGTPRLVIAGKAEFPGEFFKGNETPRPDRKGYAGMLFFNDEGTENGGLIFGGHQSSDGARHSFGHLSFDEYEENQTLSLDTSEQGDNHLTSYQINDAGSGLRTKEVLAELQKVRMMPDGAEKQRAAEAIVDKYQIRLRPRASMERDGDQSVAVRLRDPKGNTRILLRVAEDGTPTMQFLDASGKITQQWTDAGGH